MPSCAAVMAWPLNSVTNLLFLWKPPDYKSWCAVWGPFLKSSAPVLCLMTALVLAFGTHPCWEPFWSFIGSEGEVTYFNTSEAQHSRGEPNKSRFASGLWWHDRRRRESFCQHSQQGERLCVCVSYSSPSFCLCHQGSAALNPGSLNKLSSKEKFLMQGESWSVNILIHCLIFSWEFKHLSEFTQDKMTTDRLLQRWIHIHYPKYTHLFPGPQAHLGYSSILRLECVMGLFKYQHCKDYSQSIFRKHALEYKTFYTAYNFTRTYITFRVGILQLYMFGIN